MIAKNLKLNGAKDKKLMAPNKNGVITAQVGSKDKKQSQVNNWKETLERAFGNSKISEIYIPSFDCSWNFISSINK